MVLFYGDGSWDGYVDGVSRRYGLAGREMSMSVYPVASRTSSRGLLPHVDEPRPNTDRALRRRWARFYRTQFKPLCSEYRRDVEQAKRVAEETPREQR